ncbi:hypothetical protein ACFL3H_08215 [Gemmatimonadota bacterium]
MKIDLEKLKFLSTENGCTISALLDSAGVSRNAFYSLARRESILPGSILAIADYLNIPPSSFLIDEGSLLQKGLALQKRVEEIAFRHREADRDTIRHTLILLQEEPVERLRRALRRAGNIYIQR